MAFYIIYTNFTIFKQSMLPRLLDGKAHIIYLVNAGGTDSKVTIARGTNKALRLNETNILEETLATLENGFILPAKGILMVVVE